MRSLGKTAIFCSSVHLLNFLHLTHLYALRCRTTQHDYIPVTRYRLILAHSLSCHAPGVALADDSARSVTLICGLSLARLLDA